jgi:hypothetical protein
MNHPTSRWENSKIFISYRREDAPFHTDRLLQDLERHFGENSIFMDIDALKGGDHYETVIEGALSSCEVFLAVIGPKWLTVTGENNVRRLEEADDWVRAEIEAALKRPIRVIPVLVQNAALPLRKELPESLRDLVGREAEKIDDTRWNDDVRHLIEIIEEVVPAHSPSRERPSLLKLLIGAGIVLAVGFALWLFLLRPSRVGSKASLANSDNSVTNSNAAPTPLPTANSGNTQKQDDNKSGNLNSQGTLNAQATPTASPEPSPEPTPNLINSIWKYERVSINTKKVITTYEIVFNENTFNYSTQGKTHEGRWILERGEITLIWSTLAGRQTDTGTIKDGNKLMSGRGGGEGETPYDWNAKRTN